MSNINNIAYENIGKIYNLCLNNIIQNIFLHIPYIKRYKIWKRHETRKRAIKHNINEEIHNPKNFNGYTEENVENKKQRIYNIVKFQISSY